MKNDFLNYSKQKAEENKIPDIEKIKEELPSDMKSQAESLTKKYKGKSENDIMTDILKVATENKKSGKLNSDDIEKFAKNIMPMLDSSKQQKLQEVIDKLKNV